LARIAATDHHHGCRQKYAGPRPIAAHPRLKTRRPRLTRRLRPFRNSVASRSAEMSASAAAGQDASRKQTASRVEDTPAGRTAATLLVIAMPSTNGRSSRSAAAFSASRKWPIFTDTASVRSRPARAGRVPRRRLLIELASLADVRAGAAVSTASLRFPRPNARVVVGHLVERPARCSVATTLYHSLPRRQHRLLNVRSPDARADGIPKHGPSTSHGLRGGTSRSPPAICSTSTGTKLGSG
jgi:hypothetical protein